jgi:4-amino-4-deoxy-L-arabinose transferase-like glycosyltransferase
MKRSAHLVLVVAVTLLFFYLALSSMRGDSPTMDEQNHLARGLAFLRTGDPRLSLEHPPLVNSLSALPLLTMPEIRLPLDDASWEQGEWYRFADLLLWEYNHDVTRMVFLARLPIVLLTIGLAVVGYRFAQALWGAPAGLFAYTFLLLDPNILAHGRYTTTDLGGTAFLLLATYLLWRAWRHPTWSWPRVLLAGAGMGLAFGSKLSIVLFAPIYVLLTLLPLYGDTWNGLAATRRRVQVILAGLISLPVVWLSYGLEWGALDFQSVALAATGRPIGAIGHVLSRLQGSRAPMPTFWAGVDQVLLVSGSGRPSFLLGETSTEGFVAYFPVALLAKTPLAVLLLFALSLYILVRPAGQDRDRRRALVLLVPAVLYFAASMQSTLNVGYRHLLPVLPFVYLIIAGGSARLWTAPGPGWRRWIPVAGTASLIVATLAIHPHYLSYFNLLSGGPANGYRVLADSNVDWGQDLLRLQDWMAENNVDEVYLSWFGTANPTYYGVRYRALPGLPRHFDLWWDVPFDPSSPPPGVYAISASNFWELPLQEEKYVFPWFRARPPDHRVAYSILIYEVE